MLYYLKKLVIIVLAINGLACYSQIGADELIQKLKDKTSKVISFEVDATVKIDVDFINIKDRQVRIKYEAPDKFEFDTKGLVLLPKNGVEMEYMTLFNEKHTAIEAGNELIGEVMTQIIKVIPESIDSDIILAQLWIDPQENRIMRMKTFTRQSGSYLMDFEYSSNEDILPVRLVVTFEIQNMSVPVKMMNDFMNDFSTESDSLPKDARVIIEYSNYDISTKQPILP